MVLTTMRPFFVLVLLGLIRWSESKTCPSKYTRFSNKHTLCLDPNPSCKVLRAGVSKKDKEDILGLHNYLRSLVAIGEEIRVKELYNMPAAGSMMMMEWDDELAAIAQKWTENCRWGHDCEECRSVENFGVGQNIAIKNYAACSGSNCVVPNDEPHWKSHLRKFYLEIRNYSRQEVMIYHDHPEPVIRHFTQMIWAKTWRIGCGYAFYKKKDAYHKYYACNYGPAGNIEGQPVYEPRPHPCQFCPTNTHCILPFLTSTGDKYPGLCKMDNPNTAPEYPENQKGLLFHCNMVNVTHCQAYASGDGSWESVQSLGGNYQSIVLKGGQSARVSFKTPIKPHESHFCLRPSFRKGPLHASKGDQSSLKFSFKTGRKFENPMNINTGKYNFVDYGINLDWGEETKIAFTFSVPNGAGKHVLDIREIIAFDGDCGSRWKHRFRR